jgi:hypothetical protein
VFNIDITICNRCGGAVKIIACIEDPLVIKKILDHLDAKSGALASANQLPESRAPSQDRSSASCAHGISASLHVIACIEDPLVIKKILDHLDAKSGALASANQLPEPRAPPQARLFD